MSILHMYTRVHLTQWDHELYSLSKQPQGQESCETIDKVSMGICHILLLRVSLARLNQLNAYILIQFYFHLSKWLFISYIDLKECQLVDWFDYGTTIGQWLWGNIYMHPSPMFVLLIALYSFYEKVHLHVLPKYFSMRVS